MTNLPLPRLDKNPELRNCLLKYARLKAGEVWDDPLGKHRIGSLDAASATDIAKLIRRTSPKPPSVAEEKLLSANLGDFSASRRKSFFITSHF